jgi:hypothetical protein
LFNRAFVERGKGLIRFSNEVGNAAPFFMQSKIKSTEATGLSMHARATLQKMFRHIPTE